LNLSPVSIARLTPVASVYDLISLLFSSYSDFIYASILSLAILSN
jgi:hypothetical protein